MTLEDKCMECGNPANGVSDYCNSCLKKLTKPTPKDQLIKEIEKLKDRHNWKHSALIKLKESRNITLNEAISTINKFMKDFKLVKKGDLLTELDISSIKRLEGFFPDGVWGQYILKKLKNTKEEA